MLLKFVHTFSFGFNSIFIGIFMGESKESNCFKSGETEIIVDAYVCLQLCTPPLKHLSLVIYVLK